MLRLAQRLVAGVENRLRLVPMIGRERFDDRGNRPVQKQREQERRCNRLVFFDAPIGIAQALHQQVLNQAPRMFFQVAIDRREQRCEQPACTQRAVAVGTVSGQEQLCSLIEEPRRRDAGQQATEPLDRRRAGGVDLEAQLGLEARRTQHPHRILAVARLDITDQPQALGLYVGEPAHVIPDREIGDVVIERVDREIATPYVGVYVAVHVVAQQPPVIVMHAMPPTAARLPMVVSEIEHLERLRAIEGQRGLERIGAFGSQLFFQ